MPSIEQNRQKLLGGIQDGSLTPASEIREVTPPPAVPPADSKTERATPFLRAPVPSTFQLGQDSFQAFQKNNLPGNRIAPLPPSLNTGIGANAKTQIIVQQSVGSGPLIEVNNLKTASQVILNFIGTGITSDAFGGIHFPSSTGDGLTHGRSPWEGDAGVIQLTDEFTNVLSGTFNGGTVGPTGIGQLGWSLLGTAANTSMLGGTFPNIGSVAWLNSGSLSTPAVLMLNTAGQGSSAPHAVNGWALGETTGWWLTFVFKLDNIGAVTGGQNFLTTKKAMYVGLTGMSAQASLSLPSSRPDVFIGLRYDTSVTPGTLTLSSVASSSGASAVYTGTITGGAANAYAGMTFTVAGFVTHTSNNGVFACTASTVTTLTLSNAGAIAEVHAATAAGPTGLGDVFFTFEAVANPSFSTAARKNIQGSTKVTSVAPAQGVWHRLDIMSLTPGFVTMTLDGSATNTFTVAIPTITVVTTGASLAGSVTLGEANGIWSPSATIPENPWSAGSSVTVSGFAGAQAGFNGTWILNGSTGANICWPLGVAVTAGNATPGTMVGFPSLTPAVWFGSDDTTAGAANCIMAVDYFSFVWNPNLGSNAPGIPVTTNPRYW